MKKIFATITLVVLMASCGTVESGEAGTPSRFTQEDYYLTITTDIATGCNYILYRIPQGQGGITPLLAENGEPQCDK